MALKEKLLEDMKVAMREKDTVKKDTVQLVRAAVLQIEKDKKITLDDEGILDIISKEVKRRRDSIPDYEKGERQDIIKVIKSEIEILLKYLPQQLTEEELEVIIKKAVDDTGASSMKDIGKIMQEVMPKVKGKADGRMINQIIKKLLEKKPD